MKETFSFIHLLMSSQVTIIYIVLYTIQIVSKQPYSVKQEKGVLIMQEDSRKQLIQEN